LYNFLTELCREKQFTSSVVYLHKAENSSKMSKILDKIGHLPSYSTLLGRLLPHLYPLLFFAILTLALTWPAVTTFTTHYIGSPTNDARHNLWLIWHTKEALLGRQPLFHAPLLYYPGGISLLIHGIGPFMGLLALPFWPWGLVAAYNGALLLGFALTGYTVYLLARSLNLPPPAALFAGTLLIAAPMHIHGVNGHLEKAFIGLLPLALLALHHTLNPARNGRWAILVAITLLFTLLHNGLQFVLAALSIAFWLVIAFVQSQPANRPLLFRRTLIIAAATLFLTGPLLLATLAAARDPALQIDLNRESLYYQPDVAEFLLPPTFTRFWGTATWEFFNSHQIRNGIETAVFLSWVGLLACLAALFSRQRAARYWLLFAALWVVLALGPRLQLVGQHTFTEYHLPVLLPYSLLTALPGLDFLRTPGRLMLMGFVAFAIAAAYGLAWFNGRYPRLRYATTAVAIGLVLLETWPVPRPRQPWLPAPPFYQQLAADPEIYAVFDLPVDLEGWYVGYSSRYQLDQITHGKGIAAGYISRTYSAHPFFPCLIPELRPPQADVLVNGRPAPCYTNALYDLAYHNYRYVVWHKPQPDSIQPTTDATTDYLLSLFAGQQPVADDQWLTVYAVPLLHSLETTTPTMGLASNWYPFEPGFGRWAKSPATLFISTPTPIEATLQITPEILYSPSQSPGNEGTLHVVLDETAIATIPIHTQQLSAVPLTLPAGFHTLTLTLAAGNDRPSDQGSTPDDRWLSFAIRSINLQIE
jgi:hypothetical protein